MYTELRWLERQTGKTLMNEWGYYYQETVKILQYRNRLTATDYSNYDVDAGDFRKTLAWTEWMDVPNIEEKK